MIASSANTTIYRSRLTCVSEMFAIGGNYNDGGGDRTSFFNRTSSLQFAPTTGAPSSAHIFGSSSFTMNAGNCSPLSNTYVPNLPIRPTNYYPTTRNSRISDSTYYRSATITPIYSSYQGNFGCSNASTQLFSQRLSSTTRDVKYTDLQTYDNSLYMNGWSPIGFRAINSGHISYQSTFQNGGTSPFGNHAISYAQTSIANHANSFNNTYRPTLNQHKLLKTSTCRQRAVAPCGNSRIIYPILNSNDNSDQASTTTVSPSSAEISNAIKVQKYDSTQQLVDASALSNLLQSNDEGKTKNKRGQNKNLLLVSLPGGKPLFSVPLKVKKRRGRPPKPKPPVSPSQTNSENSRNTKVRYKRGQSHLQLLQSAPNLTPCVSTREVCQNPRVRTTSNIKASKNQSTSTDVKESDIQIIGCFPHGTTSRLVQQKPKVETISPPYCGKDISPLIAPIARKPCKNACVLSYRNTEPSDLDGETKGRKTFTEKATIQIPSERHSHDAPLRSNAMGKGKRARAYTNVKKLASGASQADPNLVMINTKLPNQRENRQETLNASTISMCNYAKSEQDANILKMKPMELRTVERDPTQCLDMPNIFDFLEMPTTNYARNESDNLSDLEEMMDLHLTGGKVTSVVDNLGQPQQSSQLSTSVEACSSTNSRYVRSFLSDDESDADSKQDSMRNNNLESHSNDDVTADSKGCHPSLCVDTGQSMKSLNACSTNTPCQYHQSAVVDHLLVFHENSGSTSNYALSPQKCHVSNSMKMPSGTKGFNFNPAMESSLDAISSGTLTLFGNERERNVSHERVLNGASHICHNNLGTDSDKTKSSTSEENGSSTSRHFRSLWQQLKDFNENENQTWKGGRGEKKANKSLFKNTPKQKIQMPILERGLRASAFVKVHSAGIKGKNVLKSDTGNVFADQVQGITDNRSKSSIAMPLSALGFKTHIECSPNPVHIDSDTNHKEHSTNYSPVIHSSLTHNSKPEVCQNGKNGSRKITYDSLGNRMVKRMAHRTHAPEVLVPKRQKVIMRTEPKHRKSHPGSQESKGMQTSKSERKARSRTNAMIKNLLKFTKSQNCKTGNETKSKLNADLNKVFLLGSNPQKCRFSGVDKLTEVLLEIPGPMERRARLRHSMKQKTNSLLNPTRSPQRVNGNEADAIQLNSQEHRLPLAKTLNLSASEDDENSNHCFESSTNYRTRNLSGGECTMSQGNKMTAFEDDDGDILDIHAERDSLLDMFN